jgi:hypothetical protein
MARGQEAKLRRRANRSKKHEANNDAKSDPFGDGNTETWNNSVPLPPSMTVVEGNNNTTNALHESDDDDDNDGASDDESNKKASNASAVKSSSGVVAQDIASLLPQRKKGRKQLRNADKARGLPIPPGGSKKDGGLKMLPLILLILVTGTTLFPLLLYASDMLGSLMNKSGYTPRGSGSMLGNLGYQLHIGPIPRQRVLTFYEKHDPSKIEDIPTILRKHYGSYPTLIKRLERKYHDYGYFLNWEEDETSWKSVQRVLNEYYETVWLQQYWNVYAPRSVRNAARNARQNIAMIVKKSKKIWKKQVWPVLEPVFGVPKGTEQQKRRDAAEAEKRRREHSGDRTRQKRANFRDDVDEHGSDA